LNVLAPGLRVLAVCAGLNVVVTACTRDAGLSEASAGQPGPVSADNATQGDGSDREDGSASVSNAFEPATAGGNAPTTLEPAADCVHPTPVADCRDGECRIVHGCFVMGAPRDELGAGANSNVQAQVTLTRNFWMMQGEVTNAQWAAAGWGMPERDVDIGTSSCSDSSCPVGNVSFFDAVTYANWRSTSDGLPACYTLMGCAGRVGADLACESVILTSASAYECEGYRLPTEAEWEYAARAGTTTAFYSGGIESRSLGECVLEPMLEQHAWYCYNSQGRAHPAGENSPNGWGLFDMLGNMFEWTNDLRDGLGYGIGPLMDPPGRLTPERDLTPKDVDGKALLAGRVIRGGNYVSAGDGCAAAKRSQASSHRGSSGVGFRLVRTVF
jgi:sulfatase modifying factor 1